MQRHRCHPYAQALPCSPSLVELLFDQGLLLWLPAARISQRRVLSSSLLLAFFWPRSADRRACRTFSFDWRLPAISASLLLDFQFHRTTPAEAICSSLARCGAEAESPLGNG